MGVFKKFHEGFDLTPEEIVASKEIQKEKQLRDYDGSTGPSEVDQETVDRHNEKIASSKKEVRPLLKRVLDGAGVTSILKKFHDGFNLTADECKLVELAKTVKRTTEELFICTRILRNAERTYARMPPDEELSSRSGLYAMTELRTVVETHEFKYAEAERKYGLAAQKVKARSVIGRTFNGLKKVLDSLK
jgi:hypothetical protein